MKVLRCRSGSKLAISSGLAVGLQSSQVLNLTATYTIFEAVESSRRLIRQIQEAAENPCSGAVSLDDSQQGLCSRPALAAMQRVQNSTGLPLECWIAPASQPSPQGKKFL